MLIRMEIRKTGTQQLTSPPALGATKRGERGERDPWEKGGRRFEFCHLDTELESLFYRGFFVCRLNNE